MFRILRISVLLYVLLIVAMTTWSARTRNTDWKEPLWVALYPINGDASDRSNDYIETLSEAAFQPLEAVMAKQAKNWGVPLEKPIDIKFAPEIASLPPPPPMTPNPLAVAYWSLRLRLWAWHHDTFDGPSDIRIFVVFHDPDEHAKLAHSLGLQKGFVGVVNAYADRKYDGRNNVVIAHEVLHTLGATDKYDPQTNQPYYPDGFAEPERSPLYPQKFAELMAGRIPLSKNDAKMPGKLTRTMIGRATATEIGWVKR